RFRRRPTEHRRGEELRTSASRRGARPPVRHPRPRPGPALATAHRRPAVDGDASTQRPHPRRYLLTGPSAPGCVSASSPSGRDRGGHRAGTDRRRRRRSPRDGDPSGQDRGGYDQRRSPPGPSRPDAARHRQTGGHRGAQDAIRLAVLSVRRYPSLHVLDPGAVDDGPGGRPLRPIGGTGVPPGGNRRSPSPRMVGMSEPFSGMAGRPLPGFVDIQVNGGFGHDFTADPSSIWAVAARLPECGVTAFLPTLTSGPPDTAVRALEVLASGPPAGWRGATPIGLHVEGPMLSHHRRGTHPPEALRSPSLEYV